MKNIALECKLEAFIKEKDYFNKDFRHKGNILIYKLLGWYLTINEPSEISTIYSLFTNKDNDKFEYIVPINASILKLLKKSIHNYKDIIIIFKDINGCVSIDVVESNSLSETFDINISGKTIKRNEICRNDIQEYAV